MAIRLYLKKAISSLDEVLSVLCRPGVNEQDVLLSFLFHGLFENANELTAGLLDPQQGITVPMLRLFIEYFLGRSYRFVSPEEIVRGLPANGKYVLLTFDDGYYNNVRALPVLKEYRVPAVFFISTDHVKNGKAFWWDVIFRGIKKNGGTHEDIANTSARFKALRTESIESLLIRQFGDGALTPVADLDRPFRPAELNAFAAEPYVFLGNHTSNHAILSNYSRSEIRQQIVDCQIAIKETTGKAPCAISYPNGNNSPEIIEVARSVGLEMGVGVRAGRNRLPFAMGTPKVMCLRRYALWGDRVIDKQCRASRSSVSLYRILDSIRAGRNSVAASS